MPQIRWIADAVPASMKIRQVYCVMFDRLGRVLLRVIHKPEGGVRYSLAGGRPEPFDIDAEATCRRELLEEAAKKEGEQGTIQTWQTCWI